MDADARGAAPSGAFFACYLVVSLDPRRAGKSYVGFTVNPPRRLAQHNGARANGAKYTSSLRPCDMIFIVSGFASKVQALQFEWAWQHPVTSRATRKVALERGLTNASTAPAKKTQVMCLMLGLAPWKHMALRVDVLSTHARGMFDKHARDVVPAHVDVRNSTMRDVKALVDEDADEDDVDDYDDDALNVAGDGADGTSDVSASVQSSARARRDERCASCGRELAREGAAVGCGACGARAHAACMATHFFASAGARANSWSSRLIPDHGPCPSCSSAMSWGQAVAAARRRRRARADVDDEAPTPLARVDEERATDDVVTCIETSRKKRKAGLSVSSVEKERARVRAWRDDETLFDADADADADDDDALVLSCVVSP